MNSLPTKRNTNTTAGWLKNWSDGVPMVSLGLIVFLLLAGERKMKSNDLDLLLATSGDWCVVSQYFPPQGPIWQSIFFVEVS
jgi:hypothetical protein